MSVVNDPDKRRRKRKINIYVVTFGGGVLLGVLIAVKGGNLVDYFLGALVIQMAIMISDNEERNEVLYRIETKTKKDDLN